MVKQAGEGQAVQSPTCRDLSGTWFCNPPFRGCNSTFDQKGCYGRKTGGSGEYFDYILWDYGTPIIRLEITSGKSASAYGDVSWPEGPNGLARIQWYISATKTNGVSLQESTPGADEQAQYFAQLIAQAHASLASGIRQEGRACGYENGMCGCSCGNNFGERCRLPDMPVGTKGGTTCGYYDLLWGCAEAWNIPSSQCPVDWAKYW